MDASTWEIIGTNLTVILAAIAQAVGRSRSQRVVRRKLDENTQITARTEVRLASVQVAVNGRYQALHQRIEELEALLYNLNRFTSTYIQKCPVGDCPLKAAVELATGARKHEHLPPEPLPKPKADEDESGK